MRGNTSAGVEVRLRALEPDGHVIVVRARKFTIARGGILDGSEIGRGFGRIFGFGPSAVTGDMRTMVQHAFELHAGEPGGAAHGQQARYVRSHPIIELSAQLGGFVELHGGLGGGIGAIVGDKRFDTNQIGGEFADFFERQHGMLQVIQDAQKHDDIEIADFGGGKAADIVDVIFRLRTPQFARDAKALEGCRIDGHDVRSAAFQFEGEPAIPGAYIERALAAQIGREGELGDAVAQCFETLEARDDAFRRAVPYCDTSRGGRARLVFGGWGRLWAGWTY